MNDQLLNIVEEELSNLQYEMKHLDEQYIKKQMQVRKLKKIKEELQEQAVSTNSPKISV